MAKQVKKKDQLEPKEFTLYTNFKAVMDEDTPETIRLFGYANYSGNPDSEGYGTYCDLVGDTVDPKGIDLSVYLTNPIILLQHDRDEPIGKATKVEKRKDGLWIECDVYKDACDEKTWARIQNGILKTFSIGFKGTRYEFKTNANGKEVCHILESVLFENSVVSIPANSASTFNVIKSLEDGSFYTDETELGEKGSNDNTDTGEEIMKVTRRSTLSTEDIERLKAMGLEDRLDEMVDIDLTKFVSDIVKSEITAAFKAIEDARKEAELKAAEELSAKEKADAVAKLAEEFGLSVEDAEKLSDEDISCKRKEAEDKANEDLETLERIKSFLATIETTNSELTTK